MGQFHSSVRRRRNRHNNEPDSFPDLDRLPPELAVTVLSHLNATDLCLAACVWDHLADNNLLWQSLCRSTWRDVSAYRTRTATNQSYKELYMLLDEGTCSFNFNPEEGIKYLVEHQVLEDHVTEVARFISSTKALHWMAVRNYLIIRRDVLREVVSLQDYTGEFLPVALRQYFELVPPPDGRGAFLDTLIELFAARFLECNPSYSFSQDTIFILCHSLILLSVDLSSPHVKNKMSKREFIKNLRGVVQGSGSEFTGDLYDHVYLQGHIASHRAKSAAATACKARSKPFPFERPYGKIFLHV